MSGSAVDQTNLALIAGLFLFIVGVVVFGIWFMSRRKVRCVACGKPKIAGRTTCPYCQTPYVNAPVSTFGNRSKATVSPPVLPANASPRLVGAVGAYVNQVMALRSARVRLGRAADNEIQLNADLVSRYHAELYAQNSQFILEDRNSTNGTYVNDRRIQRTALRPGDKIQIGTLVFIFQDGPTIVAHASPVPSSPNIPTPAPTTSGRSYTLGEYQITSTIGGGGAATVYKGFSLKTRAPVAVKILYASDMLLREKFIQEGEIGRSLHHPHIAQVYEQRVQDGTYYIIMEFIDGGSLRQRMAQGRPLAAEYIVPIIGQTCEALSYAHHHPKRVIHRDIKPENIMLSSRDGVKVVDFGIAKIANASYLTASGVRLGTPYYMSFEQAQGIEVQPASDIYSLGVVLYEMLTGTWPFRGSHPKDMMGIVRQHITEPPPSPRRLNSGVSPQMEAAVLRALDKRAENRFRDAMEFAAAIGYQPNMPFKAPPILATTTVNSLPDPLHVSPPAPDPHPIAIAIARLGVYDGKTRVNLISLTQNVTVLGRQEINHNDSLISRQHLRVYVANGQFAIEDVGSRNGTLFNKRALPPRQRAPLRMGDEVQVGNTILRLER